jgi:hypothetical protein
VQTLYYFEYKMPLNIKCNQFLNVGFKNKIRKLYIPQIYDSPQFFNKKCAKRAPYIQSNMVYWINFRIYASQLA